MFKLVSYFLVHVSAKPGFIIIVIFGTKAGWLSLFLVEFYFLNIKIWQKAKHKMYKFHKNEKKSLNYVVIIFYDFFDLRLNTFSFFNWN